MCYLDAPRYREVIAPRLGQRERKPRLGRQALLWGHCHQKATGGIEAEEELLRQMGVQAEKLQAGCCGLAGSWGFEAGHPEMSPAAGGPSAPPAVRRRWATRTAPASPAQKSSAGTPPRQALGCGSDEEWRGTSA